VSPIAPLPPEALRTPCHAESLAFDTTADLPDLSAFIGQERARQAVDLGVRMRHQGYNIFAFGPAGTGKLTLVRRHVEQQAGREPAPSDWCYVNNFASPSKPRALALPPGMGKQLRADMQRFTEELRTGLSAAFEGEEVQMRRQRIGAEFSARQEAILKELQERARAEGLALLRTPDGFSFAVLKDESVLSDEEFEQLPENEKENYRRRVEPLQDELRKVMFKVPAMEREFRTRARELHEEIITRVLNLVIHDLLARYSEHPTVIAWLATVQTDVVEHVLDLLSGSEQAQHDGDSAASPMQNFLSGRNSPRRYQVNVLVDASDKVGAPVIYESNPTYLNLMGRIEHIAQMGTLITDFMLIKPGCLHRANGGYLILDARKVLSSPASWEGLKRALQFREVRIESPLEMMSLSSTISLEPEPVPLDIKVILLGEPAIYYLLAEHDPDFLEFFKVSADFDDELERTPATEMLFARLIATIARADNLRPFTRSAVARLIEQSARAAEDAHRLSARIGESKDLMQEAEYWAAEAQCDFVDDSHVQRAIDARHFRLSRTEERLREDVLRGALLINTTGARIGQINGLSVVQMGKHEFGHPSRITATVRLGSGEVIDIEREVEMGGPIHSKGVLILTSYLRAHYAPEETFSLAASLVFEQNYGGVEGDSASSSELYALLSAIARVPLRQGLGVTGSVNQLGEVQAVGGLNEKIEGFFDLCAARGLTGDQGVLIPAANVQHLMLRHDVIDAVRAGHFAIYPVTTIDEGIEILTGMAAGAPGKNGIYPVKSFNRKVIDRLQELAEVRKKADESDEEEEPKPARKPRKSRKPPEPEPEPAIETGEAA
jgi:lon-related putative ATP-dependent protease